MIISDEKRFVLVHVPKCAGTSIRKQIRHLDSYDGGFDKIEDHPELGRIHYAHIPLCYLERHFPGEYGKLTEYRSYALVREPGHRFLSAVLQRMREFRNYSSPSELTLKAVLDEASQVIDWLQQRKTFCDVEFIHFARQSDFIYNGNTKIVANVYRLEDFPLMADEFARRFAVKLSSEQTANQSFVASVPLVGGIQKALRPIYKQVLSAPVRRKAAQFLVYVGAREKADALYEKALKDRSLMNFIKHYYERDFALYDALGSAPERRPGDRSSFLAG
jgi:hypothetical protein